MQKAAIPDNEALRLQSLKSFNILDTEAEARYDELTALAAAICNVPMCLISLVDEDRQWFKSHHGLNVAQTPREIAFCSHAILGDDVMEINDSRQDERFHDNPLVTGEPKVIFYAGMPLTDLDNNNLGTLCVIDQKPRDLDDDQKQALRTIANQVITNFELRRALDISQQDLDRARHSAKAKSIFLANVSYELCEPLSGITGATDLLKISELNPRQTRLIGVLSDSGEVLHRLMEDVYDLAMIEAGDMKVMNEPFDLADLLTALVQTHSSAGTDSTSVKGNTLTLDLAPTLPQLVLGDANRLRQVLTHLILRADDVSSGGEICIQAKVAEQSSDSAGIDINIIDRGSIIPADICANLFSRYELVAARDVGSLGNTGIGLATAQKISLLMGGDLQVQSDTDTGTVFTLTKTWPLSS